MQIQKDMNIDSLSNNVMRVLPSQDMTREDYTKYLLQYLDINKDVETEDRKYFIDYVDDVSLPYCIPLTPGEYLVSHGYTQDALMYLGGQQLVDKVGNLGWLLILLIELSPVNYSLDRVQEYRDIFNAPEFNVPMPDDTLDYPLWKCYHALTNSDLYLMKDKGFRDSVEVLKNIYGSTQYAIYSYLIRRFILDEYEFESDPFMESFRTPEFNTFLSNARFYEIAPDREKIRFGDLQLYNPPSVLFAEWYLDGYDRVIPNANFNYDQEYDLPEIARFDDVTLVMNSGVTNYYLGREDLVNIVYESRKYMNGAVPTIAGDKLVIAYRGNVHKIIKMNDYDNPSYRLEPEIPVVQDKLISILSILDYDERTSTVYDSMRNPSLFYESKLDLLKDFAYMFLFYLVKNGKYERAHGTPQTRIMSYLYKRILADYSNYLVKSKYYKVPIGIIENGILIQGVDTIDQIAKFDISLEDCIKTCLLYSVSVENSMKEAIALWNQKYMENNGSLKPVTLDYESQAIEYYQISAYIEYVKRLSEHIYNHNQTKETRITLYREEYNVDDEEVEE